MKIARHGFNPSIGHADQRTLEIVVSKSDRLEHGARAGAIAPIGDSTANVLEVHGQRLQETVITGQTKDWKLRADFQCFRSMSAMGILQQLSAWRCQPRRRLSKEAKGVSSYQRGV